MNLRTLLLAAVAFSLPAQAAPAPIQVMVLGTYHFESPGLDTNNIQVDSVLAAPRQRQLAAVAHAMLRFKPTHVMVEMEAQAPGFEVRQFMTFLPEQLRTDANEITQLGFRIAKLAGLPAVHGIDVQPQAGEPDYYPYDQLQATAAKLGQTALLAAANAPVAALAKRFEAAQKDSTIAQMLQYANSAATLKTVSRPYYEYLAVGDGVEQTGADLNARWYLRNAKVFGRLVKIAKPGDKVLVVYGFGHNFWLRHFAAETVGFRFVDPVPFLARAR